MNYSTQELLASLKALRLKKGLSQRALSVKVGVPQSHISRIENGMVDLQLSSFIEIARALELELVLVPPSLLPTVRYLQNPSPGAEQKPMYSLTEDGDDTGY